MTDDELRETDEPAYNLPFSTDLECPSCESTHTFRRAAWLTERERPPEGWPPEAMARYTAVCDASGCVEVFAIEMGSAVVDVEDLEVDD